MRKFLTNIKLIALYLAIIMSFTACEQINISSSQSESVSPSQPQVSQSSSDGSEEQTQPDEQKELVGVKDGEFSIEAIPPYNGKPYVVVNDNEPFFTDEEMEEFSFEEYAKLDSLGRCGVALASVGLDIMPTDDRGSIGQVKPTGWHSVKYDIVDGKYLYNRCHLIGFQLTGENANEQNLITGTRAMNVDGMLLFEDLIADYVDETGNNVYYRVTPIFEGENLLATGVLMEAKTLVDDDESIWFNVFCYNAQNGIEINYATGESKLGENLNVEPNLTPTPQITIAPTQEPKPTVQPTPLLTATPEQIVTPTPEKETITYVLNTNSKKVHEVTCRHVETINPENKAETTETLEVLFSRGYTGCGSCKP